jgi:FSR family fosmidomycin resistance protein-like MFS transporter
VITVGITGVALFGLLVGLSSTYILVAVFLVLLGIAGGGYHPAAIPLVSGSVEPQNRGRALGLHQIGGTASHFLAPLIAVGIATALGWRGSFIWLAIPVAAYGIIFYLILRRRKRTFEVVQQSSEEKTAETTSAPVRLRYLVAFLTLSIVGQTLIYAVISFIPMFIVDHFGISEAAAAGMLALVFSAGFWAGPLGGYLSDRIGTVPIMLVITLVAGPVIFFLDLVPFGFAIGALLVLVGMTLEMRMPVSEAFITGQTSERNRSTILGIYYFGSRGGPGVMAPALGFLIDQTGFFTSFTIISAILVGVTLLCSIWLWGPQNTPRGRRWL